jgi:phage terminase small subunit
VATTVRQKAGPRKAAKIKYLDAVEDLFCDYYIHSHNATRSIFRAHEECGHPITLKGSGVKGSVLLKTPRIQEMIRKKRQEYLRSAEMDPSMLLMELQKIAMARLPEIIQVSENGEQAWYDLSLIDERIAAALGEVTIETYMEGRGEFAREVKRVKIKLHNKLDAIEKLVKHFGLYKEDNEQSGKALVDALHRGRARVARRAEYPLLDAKVEEVSSGR